MPAPASAPMNCAIQYITISLALIRPAMKAPKETAGFTWQPEIGPMP